jgi:serine/threonine-protein kinase
MGTVYEAIHEQIQRRVAIKIMRPEYAANPEAVGRLFNEARAVNVIDHPALVQISDCGQLPDGSAYLVLEYLAGEGLNVRMRQSRGKLTEAQMLPIAAQLASVLTAAHAKGIVHRDLKPSNVMLLTSGTAPAPERVKLLDFGIAKLTNESSSDHDPQTRPGTFLGTPRYMSPEQCRGSREIDGKSDVYSFGIMMYQMLAGRAPFVAETDMALVAAHLMDEPTPILKLVPQTTPRLAKLIDSLLRKKKEERPSMVEVAAILNGLNQPESRQSGVITLPPPQSAPPADPSGMSLDPLLESPTRASTLRQGTGEQPQLGTKRRFSLFAGVGATALAVVGLFVVAGARTPKTAPAAKLAAAVTPQEDKAADAGAPSPPAAAVRVHFSIATTPPGADVIRESDGQTLGATPYQADAEAASGSEKYRLRRAGYRDMLISLERDRDASIDKPLIAIARKPLAGAKDAAAVPIRKNGTNSLPPKKPNSGHERTPLVD